MILRPYLAALILLMTLGWTTASFGQQPNKDVAGGGLTRDSLYNPEPPAPTPRARTTANAAQERRDPRRYKYSVEIEQPAKHRRGARHSAPVKTAAHAHPRSRNPVVRFVYWWNGWVMRTFHTKFGTVLLGSIGAES